MKYVIIALCTLLMGALGGIASAQSENDRLRTLERKIERLEEGDLIFDEQGSLFYIDMGGLIQADTRITAGSHPENSSFVVERARLTLDVNVDERFSVQLEGDFGRGDISLTSGYVNMELLSWLSIRAGQFKEPFGLEQVTPSEYLKLPYRSAASSLLAPGRDIGLMIHGTAFEGALNYALGIFNGSGDNLSEDADSNKDVAGRLVVKPFAAAGTPRWLSGLQVGTSFSVGLQDRSVVTDTMETPLGTKFLTPHMQGVTFGGNTIRFGSEVAYVYKRVAFKNEYLLAWQKGLERGTTWWDMGVNGSYIELSVMLTEDDATIGRVEPKSPFNLSTHQWGAFEAVARWGVVTVDQMFFEPSVLVSGSPTTNEISFGLNWYLSRYSALRLSYSYYSFSETIVRDNVLLDSEDILTLRFQLDW